MSAALILAFRRKLGVERTIIKSAENGIDHIYLAIDGPVNEFDKIIQEEIIMSSQKMCKAFRIKLSVLRRSKNLGLAVAVLTALEWFFSQESSGYIFEDDLVISNDFFKFCESGKQVLFETQKALLISGNQFLESSENNVATACTYPLIWGWFSTYQKWKVIKKLTLEPSKKHNLKISLKVAGFWNIGAWKARTRLIDSWAVPFAQNFHKQEYLSILPPQNLVSNVGIDEFAVHTVSDQTELSRNISIQSSDRIDFSKILATSRIREIDGYLENNVFRITGRNFGSIFKLSLNKLLTDNSEFELRRKFEEGLQNQNN